MRNPIPLALLLAWGLATSVSAQASLDPDAVEPRFEVTAVPRAPAWTLEVEIPEGWALYAPDGTDLGLPLAARWLGSDSSTAARLHGPSGRLEASSVGPVSVYRSRVRLQADGRPAGAETLEVRWALCREDLCIPGTTRIRAPAGSSADPSPLRTPGRR